MANIPDKLVPFCSELVLAAVVGTIIPPWWWQKTWCNWNLCSVMVLPQYLSCLDQRLPKCGLLAPKTAPTAALSSCHFHVVCGTLWYPGHSWGSSGGFLFCFSVVRSNLRNTWWLHCSQLLLYKQLFKILCPEVLTSWSREIGLHYCSVTPYNQGNCLASDNHGAFWNHVDLNSHH